MKRKLILVSSFSILLVILIGGVAFTPAVATIIGSVKFDPNMIDFSLPNPSVVKGAIRFDEPYDVKDIDASTIMLEGSHPPDTTYLIPGGLVAEFDGDDVANILSDKISQMGYVPPNLKVWLTITGKLKDEAGGTPFSATGYIKVIVPHNPPPP